jgi:hypothetical protein
MLSGCTTNGTLHVLWGAEVPGGRVGAVSATLRLQSWFDYAGRAGMAKMEILARTG